MSFTNKAGVKRQAVDRYIISSAMVLNYLQNQLGFQVAADFTRWTGVTANHSYVRMRVVIDPKDIVAAQPQSQLWAERVMQENAAGIQFQDNVMEILRPFMFKETFGQNIPAEDLEKMYTYGIVGDKLADLISKNKLAYSPNMKVFRLYLRPEAIIRDMLSDPKSGNIVMEDDEGNQFPANFNITGVFGVESDTIRWEVELSRGNMANTEIGVIDFDKLFT